MQRRRFLLAFASIIGLAALAHAPEARADALKDIMARGAIRVAVPQDFPPFGSVGPDMAPQGYDIDMAPSDRREDGREGRTGARHQRQPHSLPSDQQGRPRDFEPRQESRPREGHRFLRRLRAVLQRRLRREGRGRHEGRRPCGPDGRRHPRCRGGSGTDRRSRPPAPSSSATRTTTAPSPPSSRGRSMSSPPATWWPPPSSERNPPKRPEPKFLIKNSPCFIGLNKNEPALLAKVNDAIASARQDGSAQRRLAEVARRGSPGGDLTC